MAAIDNRLELAIRELRALNDVPGDWRKHAGRIVARCGQALRLAGHVRMAAALSPFCEMLDERQRI